MSVWGELLCGVRRRRRRNAQVVRGDVHAVGRSAAAEADGVRRYVRTGECAR